MSWFKSLFKKDEPKADAAAPAAAPALPKELADSPEAKGMMAMFYRKWKDPAFMKQLRTLAAHMAQDGVNIKNMAAVKIWIEKNKDAIQSGKFAELPAGAPKPETYVKTGPDVGRNDPCPCGSGKKFKKCCAAKS